MKFRVSAYLVAAVCVGLALALGWGAAWVAYRWGRDILGEFSVLVVAGAGFGGFGLACAGISRGVQRIWPLRPGEYAFDSAAILPWLALKVCREFGWGALFPFQLVFTRPLLAVLFGARVGKGVALAGHLEDLPIVSIGDGTIIGTGSVLTPHVIVSGRMVLGAVDVRAGATVGVNAVLQGPVEVGEGAVVAAGAVLIPGTRVPPRELWGGVPARKIKDL